MCMYLRDICVYVCVHHNEYPSCFIYTYFFRIKNHGMHASKVVFLTSTKKKKIVQQEAREKEGTHAVAKVVVGGPMRFLIQLTMVSAVLPPLYSNALPFTNHLRVGKPCTPNLVPTSL